MSIEFKAAGKYEVRNAKGELLGTYATIDDADVVEKMLKRLGADLSRNDVCRLRGANSVRKAQGQKPLDLAGEQKLVGKKPAEDLATRGTKAMRTAQGRPAEELTAKK